MQADAIAILSSIAVIALMTWLTRGLPFLIFRKNKKVPPIIQYLGAVLPASIMVILVVYCIRQVDFFHFPFGAPEFISLLLVVWLQIGKKNNMVSILLGTACYMILIRTIFI